VLLELEHRVLPSFIAPRVLDAGLYPDFVAVGDFNGDGIPDLAVVNGGNTFGQGGGVSVLLGNGDGSFQAPRTFAAGSNPQSVAVGDFNGDGKLDLAVADYGDIFRQGQGVSVLLGNGDGSFQAPRSFDAGGSGSVSVAIGDFNGDGKLDLVTTSYSEYCGYSSCTIIESGVRVLLGNGDGTFGSARYFAAGSSPSSVAVGDFNGDGKQDLAVAGEYGDLSVLLGNGDGSFQAARTSYVGGGVGLDSVAVGDFNGDGSLDLAATNSYGRDVGVLLGNGDGSFQAPHYFAAHDGQSVTVSDLNGDGIPDLITGSSVLLGNGDGSFQAPRNFVGESRTAVGDFNGDGIPDLAVVAPGGGVSVLLGNGDGTFAPTAAPSYAAGDFVESLAVGDFNGDGIPDLAVANDAYYSGTVSVLLGNADGSFQPARTFAAGAGPAFVAVGDFNGDGIPDLVVADSTSDGVGVLLGNGDGSFQAPLYFSTGIESQPCSVTVGDFNGDGIPDLVVADRNSGTASVLLGNGDGSFQRAVNYPIGSFPIFVAVGDFNGDGRLDFAVTYNLGVAVLLGNGDGSFQSARTFSTGNRPVSVAVGDFNGDGRLDLAVADYGSGGSGSEVSVLLGNGDGSFQAPVHYAVEYAGPVAVGDFNGDGRLDLAVAGGGGVRVLLGNGDGSFQTATYSYLAGGRPIAVGDFNGDGWPDLAVAGGNGVSILLNDGVWAGPPSGPAGRPGNRRSSARAAVVPTRPVLLHPAVVTEAPLAAAALGHLRPPVPAGPAADAAPALPAQEIARAAHVAAASPWPGPETPRPPNRARPAALAPRPIQNPVFAEVLPIGLDGSLVGDRGPLPP
jgi:hypothetical protein